MDIVRKYVTAGLLIIISYLGVMAGLYKTPGTFLVYAQSFASGSFLGLSILHFFPDAANCFQHQFPLYACVMIGVFALFSLFELIVLSKYENKRNNMIPEISDDSGKDYSIFLMHRFSAVPSPKILLIIFLFFLAHSIVIGFGIPLHKNSPDESYYFMVFSIMVEKFIETFSLTIMSLPNKISKLVIWIFATIYSVATPIMIIINFSSKSLDLIAIMFSISAGVFLFIGLLLWRKTFLTPFEWKKKELFWVSLWFFVGLLVQALTHIKKPSTCIKQL